MAVSTEQSDSRYTFELHQTFLDRPKFPPIKTDSKPYPPNFRSPTTGVHQYTWRPSLIFLRNWLIKTCKTSI